MPKVKFDQIPIKLETEWLHGFLFKNTWSWDKRILKVHPGLRKAKSLKEEKDQIKFVQNYILEYREKNKDKISTSIKRHEKGWQKIEAEYFQTLSKIIDTPWPKERKEIQAYVSINPICPRFLKDWSFSFDYDISLPIGREIVMHETCHFLYFKKWKEVFPKAKARTFEHPYIEWHLSEIMAPIILNDPRINKILKCKAGFYKEHEKLKYEGERIVETLNKMYKKHAKTDESFAEFLKDAYSLVKRAKEIFPK